jgi:dienelactone hydrolase
VIQKVRFSAKDGTTIVGNVHLPDGASGTSLPGVVIIGPMTYCKEQVPTEYATRLAQTGYAALVFDPRYRGESGGEPRCWENPVAKVEDIKSAVTYLQTRPDVDADQIAGLSICQGGSEMLPAAADDDRIKVFATVAGHYRDHEGDIAWLTENGYRAHMDRATAAKQRFEQSGEVEYVPAVDQTRMDVGMPGDFVWDWYHTWADRGVWENRYAVMSDADLLAYESLSAAQRLQTPWLMVHSDQCMLPDAARRHFDAAPIQDKQLVWEGETPHLHFYDHPEVIDPTVEKITDWFNTHLGRDEQIVAAR